MVVQGRRRDLALSYGHLFGAVSLTLVAGCASFPVAADDGGPPWIRVNTPHFSLATDMQEAPAQELAHMLEDWWSAMTVAFTRIGAPGQTMNSESDDEDDPGSEVRFAR